MTRQALATDLQHQYTVVARRYRPQQFAELIGQEHVAQSLINALQSGRVAHAYLFTGARGVGKTSAARILAKALNCEKGLTSTPCDSCDSCRAIATGEDIDVLEIDGASNNKVEEVRDLRQNVGFRPTRSRYKIYIIDEVHMLSTSAFNALLKTLEEPPPHVKFIFATTEVQKIPITILSRCQRFDFANVGPAKIYDQLKAIVRQEGHEADEDALRLIARRAAGSMRDSQSLLDQLLASSSGRLTAELVNTTLGTAGDERVAQLAAAILAHDPKSALQRLSGWLDRGLQIGELVDQMVDYWRGLMLLNCAPDVQDLPVAYGARETLARQANSLSLDSILAGLEIWTTTKARIRGSGLAQVLLEMAIVRLARLEELLSVGELTLAVSRMSTSSSVVEPAHVPAGRIVRNAHHPVAHAENSDSVKKNDSHLSNGVGGEHSQSAAQQPVPLTSSSLQEIWGRMIRYLSERAPSLAHHLKFAELPAIFGPNSLAIRFSSGYSQAYEACAQELNVAKIQDSLQKITGQRVAVKFELTATPTGTRPKPPPERPSNSAVERKKRLMTLPIFQKAAEVFGAQLWHADEAFDPTAPSRASPTPLAALETDDVDPASAEAVPDPD